MGLPFRAVGTAASGNNPTSHSPGLPSGWQPGDMHVLVAGTRNRGTTINLPAGWTQIVDYVHTNTSGWGHVKVGVRIAQSGDAAPTVTYSGGANGNTIISQIAGFHQTKQNTDGLVEKQTASFASAQNMGAFASQEFASSGGAIYIGFKGDDWTSVATLTGDSVSWGSIDTHSQTAGNDAGLAWNYASFATNAPTLSAKTFTVTGGAAQFSVGIILEVLPAIVSQASTPTAQEATASGVGEIEHPGTGALAAQEAEVAGAGEVEENFALIYDLGDTVLLRAQVATASGVAERVIPGGGTLVAQQATVVGSGAFINASGVLLAQAADTDGTGLVQTGSAAIVYDLGSTVSLIAQQASASGAGEGVANEPSLIYDIGSTISLQASPAILTAFTTANIHEDIGTPAELVAQNAQITVTQFSQRTGTGILLGQAANTLAQVAIARTGQGALTAEPGSLFGASTRFVTASPAGLLAQAALVAATTRKTSTAVGPLLGQVAVTTASASVVRNGAGSLLANYALVSGVGGASVDPGSTGSGLHTDVGSASVTATTEVRRIAQGVLVADSAEFYADPATRIIYADLVDLEAQEAVIQTDAIFGDLVTWDMDDAIWSQPVVAHAKDWPVFILENRFFQADFGGSFDREPVRVILERTGLSIFGRDRQGNWKADPTMIKFVSGIWPLVRGTPGSRLKIYVGSQMATEDPIDWEGPYDFFVGQDNFLDFTVSGRYIALRFESEGQEPWELVSYDLDLTVVGER